MVFYRTNVFSRKLGFDDLKTYKEGSSRTRIQKKYPRGTKKKLT